MPKNTKEATTVTAREITGAVTNPRDIEWPHDEYGFTTMVRKEGVRAVGRIKADPAKLAVFLDTLRTLAQHAQVKVEDQKVQVEADRAAAAARIAVELERAARDAEREADRLERMAAEARKNADIQRAATRGE